MLATGSTNAFPGACLESGEGKTIEGTRKVGGKRERKEHARLKREKEVRSTSMLRALHSSLSAGVEVDNVDEGRKKELGA